MDILLNVDKGFTQFIKEIAFNASSKYTIRLYMLISSWKIKVVSLLIWENFGSG